MPRIISIFTEMDKPKLYKYIQLLYLKLPKERLQKCLHASYMLKTLIDPQLRILPGHDQNLFIFQN